MAEDRREILDQQTASQWVGRVPDGPPRNEIPAALATTIRWRGEGIVIAIPSLLVYTTGAWMLILCRTVARQPATIENARAVMSKLRGLTVNGRPVDDLGGQHNDHGFAYQAWMMFRPEEVGSDLVFALDWPEIAPAEHQVPATSITQAMRQATILWSLPEHPS